MSRFPVLLLFAAASACGSSSAPARGPARAQAGGWIESRPAAAGEAPAAGPGRPLDRFARRLGELAIDELSLANGASAAPCREVAPPFRVISALTDSGEGVSCLVGGGAARCVNFVDHDPALAEQALCGESAEETDVPARVRAAAAAAGAGWRVAPIPAPEGYRALGVRTGDDYYLLVRRGKDWMASPLPVARTDGREVGPERLLDGRALTDDPSFLLVASSYRGGEGRGELTTRLFVLSDRLAERTVRDIGLLVWTDDPDERAQASEGAQSLRGRPHLEVLLEPSMTGDGLLRLELIREHRPEPDRRRFERQPCSPGGDGDLLGLACPLRRLDQIERAAGFWRFDAGTLVHARTRR